MNRMRVSAASHARRRSKRERGFALPAVLLILLVLIGVGLTSLSTTTDERLAGRALRESAKAFYAAEAGLNQAIATWDDVGYDTLLNVPGDSLDLGWQALENGCSYRTVIKRIDGGGDEWRRLYYVSSLGRGSGPLKGQRSLGTIMGTLATNLTRALLIGGDLKVEGTPQVLGECPGAHANGEIWGGGSLTIDGQVSATDTIILHPMDLIDSDGNVIQTESYADSIDLPYHDPMDYCGEADYLLRGGWMVDPVADDSVPIGETGTAAEGWSYDPGSELYRVADGIGAGTYCVTGNVRISGSPGSPAAPIPVSILASGSVHVSGTPYFTTKHSLAIGIMAGGDLVLAGASDIITEVDGLLYAGAQCDVGGKTTIVGQLICRGDPDPEGALDLVSESKLHGEAMVHFDCSSLLVKLEVKPLAPAGWYQRVF